MNLKTPAVHSSCEWMENILKIKLSENVLQAGGIWIRRLRVLVWMENILSFSKIMMLW